MGFQKGNPGRPKGATNLVTRAFKEGLLEAYHAIGGAAALAEWGKQPENRTAFYNICGRLIPTEVQGSSDPNAEPIRTVLEIVTQPKP